ncbi:hypothetical protein AB0467_08145 [Streptomyces sp. NPDC052095]|uniref:hypothetical protein n=1 Tax=unclassified Streptomyces TaxID=2593676 RepID=UPI00344CB9E0
MSTRTLPPVAPDVLADAVEQLSPRLRRKLDAAITDCAARALATADGAVEVPFGEDAAVTLRPGPSGTVTEAGQAVCTCLLAPRCLHRAAVLGAAPLADGDDGTDPTLPATATVTDPEPEPEEAAPDPAQVRAATALWDAAAEALSAGVTAGGAVVQAELLRAAHTARLAGLPRAEAAALTVVRGLRAARDRSGEQRLADLTGAFRELLAGAALLASGTAGTDAARPARRVYEQGGTLRVHGLCREPVLSATGYGGVTTHLVGPDGAHYTVSDVRPGGLARAKGAGSASVALGGAVLDHAGLARGGLRIVGATVSADGRLGAGRKVGATPLRGVDWSEEPAAALFARPVHEAMAAHLADRAPGGPAPELLGCDTEVIGAADGSVVVRVTGGGPLLRLRPAHPHPELPHAANLRRIAEHPGLALRVLGRPDLDRAATLLPLAVGPVPGESATLRLPEAWKGRADLGYDRLQGEHFPARPAGGAAGGPVTAGPDPLTLAPLWRVRRLLETGVAGGRRAVAEAGRGPDAASLPARLTRAGLGRAARLAQALTAEAGRRPRDPFGRLADPSADAYARAWLASAVHLAAAERSLLAASWSHPTA